ncbi:MAG: MMPL family transporter [Isosphaeraceae bacterium]
MFEAISSWVTRRSVALLILWLTAAVGLWWIAPTWDAVSRDDDVRFFPAGYPSVVGMELLERGFPDLAATSEVVLLTQRADGKLTEADKAFIVRLSERLRALAEADPELKLKKITDYREPVIGPRLIGGSGEPGKGQAACTIASISATYVSKRARVTVDRLLKEMPSIRAELPEGLRLEITGSALVGHDANTGANASIKTTTWVTILLVVAILIVVYRTPLFALIPLVTIALSVWIGLKAIASLTLIPGLNFQVINVTNVFVVVVLFGAGTDYCLFLIARYREELAKGQAHDEAIRHAIHQVGGALVASAGTVIVGLGMLSFSTFTKIRYTGPAIALCLAIALMAGLTLAPVLLHWFRDAVFWPYKPPWKPGQDRPLPKDLENDLTSTGLWAGIANLVVRRPGTILLLSLLVLAPFAWIGARTRPSFSLIADLESNQPSVIGANLIRDYFPPGELGRTSILIENPKFDFRADAGRERIAQISRKLAAMEGIAEVRSASQPLGKEPKNALERIGMRAVRVVSDRRYLSLEESVAVADRGHITRIELIFRTDPFALATQEAIGKVRELVETETSTGDLVGSKIGLGGVTAQIVDLKRVISLDEQRMYVLVTVGVYAILLVLIRKPILCLYLIATVVLGYLASLGVTELVFRQFHEGPTPWVGLDWKVGFFLFVILVAVGEDYNIFLMSRVIEEQAHHGPVEGTRRAVAHTGGIISSCGLIMAGTFGSMLTGRLVTLKELGFALSLGVLLDTFIVRPILVPAFIVLWHRLHPGETITSPIHPADEEPAEAATGAN